MLVSSSTTTANGTCPAGGTKLDFGLDTNGNGTLDADEITGSHTICNAASAPTLTSVTPTGASMKCPSGGTTVKSGADTNANGVLDDSEVTVANEICSGGTTTLLANNTAVAPGDPSCPFGSTRTSWGIDNGAGGGTAGDGILQDGEVTTTTLTCVTNSLNPRSLVPPGGAAGTAQILTGGGAGNAGSGGTGGLVNLTIGNGTGGGNVKV